MKIKTEAQETPKLSQFAIDLMCAGPVHKPESKTCLTKNCLEYFPQFQRRRIEEVSNETSPNK